MKCCHRVGLPHVLQARDHVHDYIVLDRSLIKLSPPPCVRLRFATGAAALLPAGPQSLRLMG
jgi:hypothetical protein